MKTLRGFMALILISLANQVSAQDSLGHEWLIMPSVMFVNYFPGAPANTVPPERNFQGTGFTFAARAFSSEFPDLAFVLSGGVNWFRSWSVTYVTSYTGIGKVLAGKSFRSFPLTVGVEAVFPRSVERSVMVFAGGNVGLHLVDGDIDIDQQAKFGYSIGAGFAVKVFEFGVRYYSFSDIKNIGVQLGVRLSSFPLR